MAKALTSKSVDSAAPNTERRLEIPDGGLPGLYLVVQPTGAKSWALRYRFGGKPKKVTVGAFPLFGLADARDEARKALMDLERGIDPAGAKQVAKEAAIAAAQKGEDEVRDKVKTVIADFLKRHAARNKRAADVTAMFRREVTPKWGERSVQSISKRDVIELLDGIIDRGSPITANRVRAHLNTFFGWCRGRDVIEVNPLDGVKLPAPETSRDRVLKDSELAMFWQATSEVGPPFGDLYRFLLLTGQRLREAAEMTEHEVSGDIWAIPSARSKNGDEHSVPLSDHAKSILKGVPRVSGKPGFIFTTTGGTPVSGFTRAKERLDRAMSKLANEGVAEDDEDRIQIPPFTIHDLRRTAATGMADLRFPPHVVEAVLNHKSGTRRGVAAVYNRGEYFDDRRAALDAWARRIEGLVCGNADNVVQIVARANGGNSNG